MYSWILQLSYVFLPAGQFEVVSEGSVYRAEVPEAADHDLVRKDFCDQIGSDDWYIPGTRSDISDENYRFMCSQDGAICWYCDG